MRANVTVLESYKNAVSEMITGEYKSFLNKNKKFTLRINFMF